MKIVVVEQTIDEGIVEGTIVARVKSGLLVTTSKGGTALLPSSQVDVRPVRDLDALIGERHRFRVIKYRNGGKMVVSRRVLLEAERAPLKEQTLATIKVGQIREGVVKVLTDYGAFIDLGGIEGLLHFEGASSTQFSFQIDDRIQVRILDFNPETERIYLGLEPRRPG